MLKTFTYAILAAVAAIAFALTVAAISPVKSQEACLTFQEALDAHPGSQFYRLEGNSMAQFAEAYKRRFRSDLPPIETLVFFEIHPDQWFMGVFDGGCFDPSSVAEVDITAVKSLIANTTASP